MDKKKRRKPGKSIDQALGETLRSVRRQAGLSQAAAAEALGTSQPAVSRWENGTQPPTYSEVVCASVLYQSSPTQLYTREVENAVPDSIRDRARRLEQTINSKRQGR